MLLDAQVHLDIYPLHLSVYIESSILYTLTLYEMTGIMSLSFSHPVSYVAFLVWRFSSRLTPSLGGLIGSYYLQLSGDRCIILSWPGMDGQEMD